MKQAEQHIASKIFTREGILQQALRWRLLAKKIVFTNGCFDILHRGHLHSLNAAAGFGDVLVVGVNSDASVSKLKGPHRPVNDQDSRSLVLASLVVTDAIVIFEEDTPQSLIEALQPDVLVKGGDYTVDQIAGAEDTLRRGGEVKIVPLVKGYSTSAIIQKIQSL